jgi:flagellar export protein FliJ
VSSLKTVIRLHKTQLDEKRRELVELQNLGDQLHGQLHQLDAEVLHEQQIASLHPEVAFSFASYIREARVRRQRLEHQIAHVNEKISIATDAMAEAFQELKRFELAEEERVRCEKAELRHKEELMLDETALVGFRRRQHDESEAER